MKKLIALSLAAALALACQARPAGGWRHGGRAYRPGPAAARHYGHHGHHHHYRRGNAGFWPGFWPGFGVGLFGGIVLPLPPPPPPPPPVVVQPAPVVV